MMKSGWCLIGVRRDCSFRCNHGDACV